MTLRRTTVFALLGLLSVTTWATPEVTAYALPKNLHVYSASGNGYVDLEPHGCSQTRYEIPSSHPQFAVIMDILLTAQTTNHQVSLRFDGCNGVNQGTVIGVYLGTRP